MYQYWQELSSCPRTVTIHSDLHSIWRGWSRKHASRQLVLTEIASLGWIFLPNAMSSIRYISCNDFTSWEVKSVKSYKMKVDYQGCFYERYYSSLVSPDPYLKQSRNFASQQVCVVVRLHNIYGFLHGPLWPQTLFFRRPHLSDKATFTIQQNYVRAILRKSKRVCLSPRDLVPHLGKHWEATIAKNSFPNSHPPMTIILCCWFHGSLIEELIFKKRSDVGRLLYRWVRKQKMKSNMSCVCTLMVRNMAKTWGNWKYWCRSETR